jgi:TM2 domain-containing membrane protein YozV
MYSVVGSDGQIYGPVDIDVLKQWCLEGRIIAHTSLIDAISGQVIQAKDVYELAEQFFNLPPGPMSAASFGAPPVQAQMPPPQPFMGYTRNMPIGYSEPKQKVIAGVLGILLGPLGVHRFYLGYNGIGIAMLLITILTCGWGAFITGIWGLIEGIMCLTGSMTDSDGRPLV